MTDPGADAERDLGPVSLAIWRAAPFLPELTEAERAAVGSSIELRRHKGHMCVICGYLASAAVAVNPKTIDLSPRWADLCWAHMTQIYREGGGRWHDNTEPPGPRPETEPG